MAVPHQPIVASSTNQTFWYHIKFITVGILFGILLTKSEVTSWYRIQEMFRLQSFHMYGIIGSAILVAMISLKLLKIFNVKSIENEYIKVKLEPFSKGHIYGGLLFGVGWAFTGACPGPMFALVGSGVPVAIVMLLSAVAGTWFYGYTKDKLPH
jgi:uncharacterized protein